MNHSRGRVDYDLIEANIQKLRSDVRALRKEVRFLREALVQSGHAAAIDYAAKKVRQDDSVIPGERGPSARRNGGAKG